jgi:hypothetical protein
LPGGGAPTTPPLSFLPVQISGPSRDVIEVLLANGTRVLVPRGDRESLQVVLEFAGRREERSC